MNDLLNYNGKICVVTGAASGMSIVLIDIGIVPAKVYEVLPDNSLHLHHNRIQNLEI